MMMRGEDLMSDDKFWDVKERERQETERIRRDILQTETQIALQARAETIRNAPGFTDFLNEIKKLHALARETLVGDERLTDAGLREQRGKVKGIESILAVLTNPRVQPELAAKLAASKNELAEALRRRPKPKSEEPKEQVTS